MATVDTQPGSRSDDIGKFLLRLAVGGLMLFHGISKVRGWINDPSGGGLGEIPRWIEETGLGLPGMLAYGVYIGEVLAPVLILLGFWTRLGAFLLAINMVVAVLLRHTKDVLTLNQLGGWAIELEAWFFLGALALLFLGAGRFSVSKGKGWLN
jgi:putative oxidoreductase